LLARLRLRTPTSSRLTTSLSSFPGIRSLLKARRWVCNYAYSLNHGWHNTLSSVCLLFCLLCLSALLFSLFFDTFLTPRVIHYPAITYYWTCLLILDHSYLVGNLTYSKIA
jgi:hypothetical protein